MHGGRLKWAGFLTGIYGPFGPICLTLKHPWDALYHLTSSFFALRWLTHALNMETFFGAIYGYQSNKRGTIHQPSSIYG